MPLDPGVKHLGSDRYQVVVYAGKDRSGKQRQHTRSFRAKNDQAANRAAPAVKAKLRTERAGLRPDSGTVGEYVAQWLADNEGAKSPTTMKAYRITARRITERWGTLPLRELTTPMVRAWYTDLRREGMTPATMRHQHTILRIILRQAAADNLAGSPATFGVKMDKPTKRKLDLPKDADMLRLVRSCTGELGVAVRLAAACGLRRGELVGLRWCDIAGREVLVRRVLIEAHGAVEVRDTTKGKRDRAVALDGATMRALAAHRRHQRGQAAALGVAVAPAGEWYVLADMAGDPTGRTPLSPSWLSHGWAGARGTAKVRLHDLRHWYATKILESGQATVAELSQWLGHAQVSTTMDIYVHTAPERRRVSAAIMGGILDGQRALSPGTRSDTSGGA